MTPKQQRAARWLRAWCENQLNGAEASIRRAVAAQWEIVLPAVAAPSPRPSPAAAGGGDAHSSFGEGSGPVAGVEGVASAPPVSPACLPVVGPHDPRAGLPSPQPLTPASV
jgi:hypothetical protein